MPSVLAHDWFRPRLTALLAEADAAGYARDVSEAAITDLVNGELAAAIPASPPDDNWARDIGEPAEAAHEMPTAPALPPETGNNDPRGDFPAGIYGGRGVDI
jgi:hypothetical protein